MPDNLPTLSEVLVRMGPIQSGDTPIPENFILVFDLTKTWLSAASALYDNDGSVIGPVTLPTEAQIRAGLAAQYSTIAHQNALSQKDLDAATNPVDMTKVSLPYIDGSSHYILKVDSTLHTWQLVYSPTSHAILSGTIQQNLRHESHLIGAPVGDGAMIEFPVAYAGASGARLVDEDGAGILQFSVYLIPRVVATGAPLSKIPNSEVVDEILN